MVAAQEAVRLLDEAVTGLQGRVDVLQGSVSTLSRQTAVTTRTVAVPFLSSPTGIRPAQFSVSCGDGKALSGSAQTTGVRIDQSHVTANGSSWYFDIRSTSTSPSATVHVVCAGATSTPGGGSGPVPVPGSPG